jgi:hypothetical protein
MSGRGCSFRSYICQRHRVIGRWCPHYQVITTWQGIFASHTAYWLQKRPSANCHLQGNCGIGSFVSEPSIPIQTSARRCARSSRLMTASLSGVVLWVRLQSDILFLKDCPAEAGPTENPGSPVLTLSQRPFPLMHPTRIRLMTGRQIKLECASGRRLCWSIYFLKRASSSWRPDGGMRFAHDRLPASVPLSGTLQGEATATSARCAKRRCPVT